MPPTLTAISPALPRRALVTGGARRLGRAMVLALAEAGFDIVLHCRTADDDARQTQADVQTAGQACLLLTADLSIEAEVHALAAAAGPGLGVLVNSASVFEAGDWHNTARTDWDRHLEPNLRAPFVLMQHFARQLAPAAEGVIVNLLDQRVWSLTPHFVAYTLSKIGLWGLTQTMALALAPRIRVNAIGPGPALPSTRQTREQFDAQCRRLPLGHGTNPEEIGRALLAILALPSLTGQMLALDGGQHLQWGSAAAPPEE